ncbi:MAG TPA: DUF2865 domain-containing protein [Sinorhizobium sp.]|nr:DUF2865 domain-containing protein [Sinorhizobium sp.]
MLLPLALATTGQASAQDVCEGLRTHLAALPAGSTSTANLRDFTGAVSRQNIELRRAKNDRRRMGCSHGSIIVIDGENAAACAELEDAITRMEDNLQRLKAHRRQLVSTGNEDARRRILAAMEINGCLAGHDDDWNELDEFATADEEDIHRNILRDLSPDSEDYPLLFEGQAMDELPPMEGTGGFRTMCVRTCDGAFFPISSNATPADFGRDAELCRARCPGADTELYYHVLATEESDQMVSASTGRPYSELPTAFAYRTREPGTRGSCGCQIPKTATSEAGQESGGGARLSAASPSVVAIEGATTDSARTGAAGTSPAKPAKERPYDPKNSNVRIVGPTFLPQEESAIDLKNPLGPRYQPLQDE